MNQDRPDRATITASRPTITILKKTRTLDLRDLRFGELVVLEYAGTDRFRNAMWKCRCDCGNITSVRANDLLAGNSRSCGCAQERLHAQQRAAARARMPVAIDPIVVQQDSAFRAVYERMLKTWLRNGMPERWYEYVAELRQRQAGLPRFARGEVVNFEVLRVFLETEEVRIAQLEALAEQRRTAKAVT